jgi:hypothetical protein
MTQIPIPITVEVSAAAATPEVTSASLYPSLLASVDAMAEPALWVLMEATVYSLRQRDTLTRSIKECGTVECFGNRWPQDFDFLPTDSEAIALVEAIADQFIAATYCNRRLTIKASITGSQSAPLASALLCRQLRDTECHLKNNCGKKTHLSKQTRPSNWTKGEILDGIFYQLKNGCNWEDLPNPVLSLWQ